MITVLLMLCVKHIPVFLSHDDGVMEEPVTWWLMAPRAPVEGSITQPIMTD